LAGPAQCGRAGAAEDDRRPAVGERWGTDRDVCTIERLTPPRRAQRVELRVEQGAAVVEVPVHDRVVVETPANTHAQPEPSLGDVVQRGRLLGQQSWLSCRSDQHRGHQPDPLGDGRGRRERDQLFVGVEGDAADGAQHAEPTIVRRRRPVDQCPSLDTLQRVREADAHVHSASCHVTWIRFGTTVASWC
jgi:hypothetical protein